MATRMPCKLFASLLGILLLTWFLPPVGQGRWHDALFSASTHTLLEFAAIVAALMVFGIAWHARNITQPGNNMILGCGFLAVALLDLGHVMSYRGMPDFVTPAGIEKGISFWLVARYVAVLTLLAAALRPNLPWKSVASSWVLLGLSLGIVALFFGLNLYVPHMWPRTFVEGQGLTPFKMVAEGGVLVLSGLAAYVFCHRLSDADEAYSKSDLCAAAMITVLSEACLMVYADIQDVYMLLGHVYKTIAYVFIYRAVFITSVRDPYRRLNIEVIERREAEQRASYLAYHDVLTTLPNRELARDRLSQAVADARRHGSHVALIFLDLDHFKNINDSLGHTVGDQVLQAVARRLSEHVRDVDTVSRQGGDEFLIILKDVPDVDAVAPIVTKLIEAVSQTIVIDGQELSTSVSAGVAMCPFDGDDADTLMQRADTAMYRAKEEGRNTFRFFDDRMNAESVEKLTLRNGLRHALDQRQFLLYYQPQIELSSGKVVGVEALLRWQHPQWGLVPPARFIPVAEESGLIVPLGTWVIQEACRQAAHWRAQGLPDMTMAVNLSALQFKRGEVEAVVSAALEAWGLPAHLLELELTESLLISDPEAVQRRLLRLKALGVKLAIDDFGTGYSSLSYLKRFSVDKLKIDQSFVRDLERRPDDVAIVRAIIQMADGLGLRTIAEGVETLPMSHMLRSLGCHEGQGYWFTRPLPPAECEAWLKQDLALKEADA